MVSSEARNMRYASGAVIVSGARIVTFDWRTLAGMMNGRQSIGEMALSIVIRSTSPRSSHLNFLLLGNFLQSCTASRSPGSVTAPGAAGAASAAGAPGAAAGAGAGAAGAAGVAGAAPGGLATP